MSTVRSTILAPCDKRRILIADDEAPVREIFRMILTYDLPDYTIDTVANGFDAVQSFQQFHQTILLMDMKMPQMDGQTTLSKIREICNENGWEMPAVIFCTGLPPSADDPAPSFPEPQHIIIQKPVARNTLLAAVNSRLT